MFGIENDLGFFSDEWKKFFLLITFFHWWTIWFVLGRSFTETTFLLTVSRCCQYLLISIVPGFFEPLCHALIAALVYIALFFLLDSLVLKTLMRRYKSSFKWDKYDAISIFIAHSIYVSIYLIFPVTS